MSAVHGGSSGGKNKTEKKGHKAPLEPLPPIRRAKWTHEREPNLMGKDKGGEGKKRKKPAAYRDLVVEKTGQRLFQSFMEKV